VERANRLQLNLERSAKCLASARETGHDRSNRNLQHIGQLLVRETLEFAKHEKLAKTIRQIPQGLSDERCVGGMKQ
jgi:hypothetical protein